MGMISNVSNDIYLIKSLQPEEETLSEFPSTFFNQDDILQEEVDEVRKIFKHKFSQVVNKFNDGARNIPGTEETKKKELYQAFFDAIDRNLDGRMDIREIAVMIATRGKENLQITKLKEKFRIMDIDSNGFVDAYE